MTDKELKEKILAEIKRRLLKIQISSVRSAEMDGAEIVLNALLSFVNSQPEEPEFTPIEKEVLDAWTARIDKKRVPITLKGDIKHKFRNEFHTMWQTVGNMQFANVAKALMERLCLHFAAWGAYNLKNIGNISEEEKAKMDTEELVSKDLEEAINVASEKERLHKAENESRFFSQVDFASGFIAGVQWKEGKQ